MSAAFEPKEIDRRIWREELNEFLPQRIFDAHTHVYRWAFYTAPDKQHSPYASLLGEAYQESDWRSVDQADAALMPGREVHRLAFPFPFPMPCDFAASNAFLANEVKHDPASAALMLVHPGMGAEELKRQVDEGGFLGFKPYRVYSATGDAVNCRITDFLPEHQIEVAHQRGLLIMMHLAKRDAIADPENLADLKRLTDRFPNARWILAHCARSYSDWPILAAAEQLRQLPNVWFDTSSVCESDAIEALCRAVGVERVMYGSDDLPVGVGRGKYIAFGRAWAYLNETNHQLNLTHCRPEMTFVRYEQLRAMRRAADRLELTRRQIEAMFHDTAARLIADVRGGT